MADFITCSNNIDAPTMMRALFGRLTSLAGTPTKMTALRTYSATRDTRVDAVNCMEETTFWDMMRKSIHLSPDNRPSLRVCTETFEDGSGLTDAFTCASGITGMEVIWATFCKTTDGEWALLIANVTES